MCQAHTFLLPRVSSSYLPAAACVKLIPPCCRVCQAPTCLLTRLSSCCLPAAACVKLIPPCCRVCQVPISLLTRVSRSYLPAAACHCNPLYHLLQGCWVLSQRCPAACSTSDCLAVVSERRNCEHWLPHTTVSARHTPRSVPCTRHGQCQAHATVSATHTPRSVPCTRHGQGRVHVIRSTYSAAH